jgi:exosome complex component RRP45
MASSYIAIRDDAGLKSLSTTERDFTRACALHTPRSLRTDGRNWNQLRHQRLNLIRWENGSSCTLQWGTSTRVTATVSAELIPPVPDRPSEGMLTFSVDLSPAASTSYRQAMPATTGMGPSSSANRGLPPDEDQKLTSNRILRCLERILITGGALDTEALCVTPEQWVWKLSVAVTVLDAGGNLLDASALACMAALRHYRKPHVQLNSTEGDGPSTPELIPSHVKEPTPLPLHHTPLCISFALIPEEDAMRSTSSSAASQVATLVDPNQREELVMTGVLTIAMNVHAEVCLLDYGGGCELHPDKLRECWTLAAECIQQLCKSLEVSLEEADGQALQERLTRLQQQQQQEQPNEKVVLPPSVGADNLEGVPFFQSVDGKDDLMQIDEGNVDADQAANIKAQNEAEEAYRRNALDYNLGHVANKVREDDKKEKDHRQQASSLLTAMLQFAQDLPPAVEEDETALTAKGGAPDAGAQVKAKVKPASSPKQKQKKTVSARASTRAKTQEANAADSDDEEDTTVQLRSEFQPDAVPDPVQVPESKAEPMDGEDVDDLAAAIKTKKKKPKKSKK